MNRQRPVKFIVPKKITYHDMAEGAVLDLTDTVQFSYTQDSGRAFAHARGLLMREGLDVLCYLAPQALLEDVPEDACEIFGGPHLFGDKPVWWYKDLDVVIAVPAR